MGVSFGRWTWEMNIENVNSQQIQGGQQIEVLDDSFSKTPMRLQDTPAALILAHYFLASIFLPDSLH